MAKISHSELFWTTLVGKYWKSWKTAKIGHSESIQTTSVGKYWKSWGKKWPKLTILNQFRPLRYENIEKFAKQQKLAILNDHFSRKILEKLQNV